VFPPLAVFLPLARATKRFPRVGARTFPFNPLTESTSPVGRGRGFAPGRATRDATDAAVSIVFGSLVARAFRVSSARVDVCGQTGALG